MADYKKIIPKILKWEGGYAGNIDGMICTMKGVTLSTYRQFYGKTKTCKDLRNISNKEWEHIFKEGFWDKCKADDINNQSVAELIVDWSWASGAAGRKLVQQVLGVKQDGIFGPVTLNAINNYPNQHELFDKLWNRRKQHFLDIVKTTPYKQKFLQGWLNRLNDYKWQS